MALSSGKAYKTLVFDHTGGWTGWVDNPMSPAALCPDLLRFEQIGEADNLRGRVVRAFFWLMRIWPT